MVKGMKKSNGEGIASHTGPAPCADVREGESEASAGVRAGQVLSRESRLTSGRRRCRSKRKAKSGASISRDAVRSPARSETLRTLGVTLLGNREIPGLPAAIGTAGRVGKPKGESRR